MRFSLVSPTLLCFLTWMSSVYASQRPGSCFCIGWSNTQINLTKIVNYTVQSEGVCPVAAVVFKTKGGKVICSDPNSKWAKRAIEKVDKETRGMLEMEASKEMLKMEQNEPRSTSDITTTVSTTSKKAPGKKGRTRRRRQRKRSRSGRKRQRACT